MDAHADKALLTIDGVVYIKRSNTPMKSVTITREDLSMDAYDAIDILDNYVTCTDEHDRAFAAPTEEEFDAIKIALEALKERARVI